MTNEQSIYDLFAALLGPMLYQGLAQRGIENIDAAYDNMIRQLAWESNYGRSPVARKQHNYGGYGWNGKTYTTFKDDLDFINHYLDLMTSRYAAAVASPDTISFARNLKNKGYYEDSFKHYSSNLAAMKSMSRAAASHRKNFPDLYSYTPAESTPNIEEQIAQKWNPVLDIPSLQPMKIDNPTQTSFNYTPQLSTPTVNTQRKPSMISLAVENWLFNEAGLTPPRRQ